MSYAQAESLDGEGFGISNFSVSGVFPRQAESDYGGIEYNSRGLFFDSPFKAALLDGRARYIRA